MVFQTNPRPYRACPWLGAPPDRVVWDPEEQNPHGIVEVKCPYSMKDFSTPATEGSCLVKDGQVYAAVMIRRLSVPRWVRNGTEQPVVLDCEYVYNENDLKLVVKWYFNESPEPVYQWIPEMKSREAFGVLQGRLDPSFSVNSRDDYSQYRAIRILQPTMELTGKYTCVVTSLAGQDTRHQEMTIYVPAESFSFNYTSVTGSRSVELTCLGQGLFPKPDLKLYSVKDGERRPAPLPGVRTITSKSSRSLFNVLLRAQVPEDTLPSVADIFECVLEIPRSNYMLSRRMSVSPELTLGAFGTSEGSSLPRLRACYVISAYIIYIVILFL